MFSRGLVIGKFYPPHTGHGYLIETAQAQCKELTIIVCANKTQSIPGELRAEWLQRLYPDARVIPVDDSHMDDDDSPGWATYTKQILGFTPDAVFTSEDYGTRYAALMGSTHVLVDKERTHVPISGTLVRSNPYKYGEFLAPCVRAYFVKRIAVVGAESTGKTTLARDLAAHYQAPWVLEYGGRFYYVGKQTSKNALAWNTEEFVHIARMQNEMEDALAEISDTLLICDTDAFATGIWHERYVGSRSPEVEAMDSGRNHELYILTGDEIPFVQDGLRDGEHIRHGMHERFKERLREEGKRFVAVSGTREERLAQAVAAIDALGIL